MGSDAGSAGQKRTRFCSTVCSTRRHAASAGSAQVLGVPKTFPGARAGDGWKSGESDRPLSGKGAPRKGSHAAPRADRITLCAGHIST